MVENCRIVFSGSGGQGVITAAILLAEAAVMVENLNAVQSQSYGPEARGGATRSDVIISAEEIFYPKVQQPNLLICLTQKAYDKYSHTLRPGGILLTDAHFVETAKTLDAERCELPIYETVINEIGKPVVFNIAVLGALLAIWPLVTPDAIIQTLRERLPADFLAMNRRALEIGLALGRPCHRERGR